VHVCWAVGPHVHGLHIHIIGRNIGAPPQGVILRPIILERSVQGALGPTPTLPTYHRRLLRTMPLL
jgi:hypothetical protein